MKIARKQDFLAAVLTAAIVSASTLTAAVAQPPGDVPEILPGLLKGYLPWDALPNSLALLPPPPPVGSAAYALDEEVARQSVALRGTPRWAQATVDADLHFPDAAGIFSCALNAPISRERTPRLYVLLRRTLTDVGLSTAAAKDHYQRTRPFAANNEPICTPTERAALANDGSYPSGHTAVGWAWALILSEIAPAQTNAVIARGTAFGESRNVCNVHWHSDVVQGRVMGAATLARMHAEPAFRADVEAAKLELADVRARDVEVRRDCAGEAAALAFGR